MKLSLKWTTFTLRRYTQVPIDVIVQGVDTGIIINLEKVEYGNNLTHIDSIKINTEPDSNEIVIGKYFVGSSLDYGKYKIFVDSTNLTKGYYIVSIKSTETMGLPLFYRLYEKKLYEKKRLDIFYLEGYN